MCTSTDFACGDPRDTIFFLCSLAREIPSSYLPRVQKLVYTPPPPPNPDYSKSFQQVYAEFVKFSIASSGSLDIICRPWAVIPGQSHYVWNISRAKVPSWICLATNAGFGVVDGLSGRINGDSLVGSPSSRIYQASHSKLAEVQDVLPSYHSKPSGRPPRSPAPPDVVDSGNGEFMEPSLPDLNADMALQVKSIIIGAISWMSNPTMDGVISCSKGRLV